ncbi:serine/threonine protein phosphatase [Geothermobacter hydrogeniphilus]|uniref:Serine/threonine protein phosphatase n=1 Tax=Geothermobacter hydrogeniphilus TaxID=1969733 RepID=A0A2K2HDH3_9BACT|nr:metallophosphoesterase family protein [Geothermobacter hydrogeniphilus]PNU21352.1 serine/threonine protein phosphatase [Geothermobacter hydrogeniphilus]
MGYRLRNQSTVNQRPGRLLAVGDIHGCDLLLRELLAQVKPTEKDQLVFLGDYIDRGSGSRRVIEQLLALRRTFPQTVFLKGNHEQMLLAYLAGNDEALDFLANGGGRTLENYRTAGRLSIPEEHLDFFTALRNRYETEDFIFVHAGLRPGIPSDRQSEADLLWIRSDFLDSDYDWGKTVVFGHTPQPSPIMTATRIGLDTGAVYGRQLSCCDVLTRRLWSAG